MLFLWSAVEGAHLLKWRGQQTTRIGHESGGSYM